MAEPVIVVKNLYYRYPHSNNYVLNDINFSVQKGEFLAISGENGAGKSTLSLILSGIIPQTQSGKMQGNVWIENLNTKEHELSVLSQKVGIVLEDPETQLFTTRVFSEVAFGAENLEIPREEIIERVNWALKAVTLEGYEQRPPTMLSGGQKQRVAIAATLAMHPDILVLDEPTSQLDPIGTLEVFEVIKNLKENYGMTIIMVSHNSEEIALYADHVLVLNEGSVLAYGTPKEIFANSKVTSKAWLTIPQVSELYLKLKLSGFDMGEFPILKDQGVLMLKERLKRKVINCE